MCCILEDIILILLIFVLVSFFDIEVCWLLPRADFVAVFSTMVKTKTVCVLSSH